MSIRFARGFGRAMAVVDAVVAGQVARRLGRGHQVVGRDGVRAVRQRHLLDRRAQPLVDLERRADGLLDLGVEALAEVLAGPRRSSAA